MNLHQTKKVVVVTGGASGIGWATALRFVSAGWFVVIADRDIANANSKVAEHPGHMEAVEVDVTSEESVQRMSAELFSRHGYVSALVNSAGIQKISLLSDFDWKAWEAVMQINLEGTLRCMRAVGTRMVSQGGGAIVNLSSVSGERGPVGRIPYAASKAGVVAITRSAGAEWARAGVRINAVAPGYVSTAFLDEHVRKGELSLDVILNHIPMGRLAEPVEIANVIYFLCTSEASYITGQVIFVDGGFLVDFGIPVQGMAQPR